MISSAQQKSMRSSIFNSSTAEDAEGAEEEKEQEQTTNGKMFGRFVVDRNRGMIGRGMSDEAKYLFNFSGPQTSPRNSAIPLKLMHRLSSAPSASSAVNFDLA
jgi:hypothetical protein